MDCPHCHAALSDGAPACSACGVDLVKLKAREVLAKLKNARPAAPAAPPWTRSVVFLGAMAFAACLLLYGATLLAGRSLTGRAPVAAASQPASEEAAPAPVPAPTEQASAPPERPRPVSLPHADPTPPPATPLRLIAQPDGTWRAEGLRLPEPGTDR